MSSNWLQRVGHSSTRFSILLLSAFGCFASHAADSPNAPQEGRWITGDLHIHTALSADARTSLDKVVSKGMDEFDLDYMAISNHLRNSSRDNIGHRNISQLLSQSLQQYEWPALQRLRAKHGNKLLLSTFEWDAPGHDHINVGLLPQINGASDQQKIDLTRYFEYRFGAKNTLKDFAPEQLAQFNEQQVPRQNKGHADTLTALRWLQTHYPHSSYVMLNHPTRYSSSYTIEDIRQLNDAAPDVFFMVEGMVGNQFNGFRGDYNDKSRAGLLGGVDPLTAQLGGNWDALLGEGRHLWLMANSDHHFKAFVPHASGYFPGEYAKTYTYLADQQLNRQTLLKALRSGNSFSVFGDIIDELHFTISTEHQQSTMGQTMMAQAGERVTVTIEVAQPSHSNREKTVGDEHYEGEIPALHHIDLIAGRVTSKAEAGTPAYAKETNPTTHVVKSFNADNWQDLGNGRYRMTYEFTASEDQYYRLRGTTLSYQSQGYTKQGEPLRSKVVSPEGKSSGQYYKQLNERNYKDTWFYSNPIFIRVNSADTVTVESANLRYDNPDDGVNAWPNRRDIVLQHLQQQQPDIIATQEVLAHQFDWLKTHLTGYQALGVGRDDGKRAGEFVPVFFNQQRLTLLDSGYFWLSETPSKAGSIGWQADLPRVSTWAKLQKGEQRFLLVNTHFSHVSDLARRNSAEFLLRYIPKLSDGLPVILTGDFNAQDTDSAYQTLHQAFNDSVDSDYAEKTGTYNDFGQARPSPRIDYIFYSSDWHADTYQTHQIKQGQRYISDHFPISVRLQRTNK